MTFFDSLCPEHGGLSHLVLHEAAHAVAALEHGIRFTHVAVLSPEEWITTSRGIIGGGVWLVEQRPELVVGADPVAAMRFALAGALAEIGAFGHSLDGSHEGDIRYWRIGAGLLEAQTAESFDRVLGKPFREVELDTQRWLSDNYKAIRAVTIALARVTDGTLQTLDIEGGRRPSENEVAVIVRASDS
jgi:hypothetical protein